jgi:hypothetical protein
VGGGVVLGKKLLLVGVIIYMATDDVILATRKVHAW